MNKPSATAEAVALHSAFAMAEAVALHSAFAMAEAVAPHSDRRASGSVGGSARASALAIDDRSATASAVAIRLEHLTKSFGGRKVLDDVTLDVREGEAFCLLGRSGTGKSVTLKHIVGLLRPDEGRVIVHGKDVPLLGRYELAEVRRSMGFLFQNAALFDSITVGENVAFPLRRHTDWPDDKIREVANARLEAVGLEHDFDKMPADLSGGMKKRAALARAMVLDPDILLVDEPSAGLDPITSGEIDQLLLKQKEQGATLVVVTHNIPSARHVGDTLAFLHEGRVIARGTAEDLERSDNEMVRAFMQSEGSG